MMREWLRMCFRKTVMRRSLKYSIIVGTLLVAINHGDTIIRGEVETQQIAKMMLTFLVPYTVSTLSSVGAMREMHSR